MSTETPQKKIPWPEVKAWLMSFHIVGAIATVLAIGSFFASLLSQQALKWLLVLWTVLPPVYFFIELHWVRRFDPCRLSDCKMSQESAAKIWVAVVAALTLLYLERS